MIIKIKTKKKVISQNKIPPQSQKKTKQNKRLRDWSQVSGHCARCKEKKIKKASQSNEISRLR